MTTVGQAGDFKGSGQLAVAVAVADKELPGVQAFTDIHGEIADLLGEPCAGRMRGYARYLQSAGAMLDEDQNVDPPEQHRVHGEELTDDHPVTAARPSVMHGLARLNCLSRRGHPVQRAGRVGAR
ncbi:MAG: hypothetical protein JWR24_1674 [Actinoallomurus sp.]|nr:hypothetical protein [Actinoallomurus sp.]